MPENAPNNTDPTHLRLKEIAGEVGVTATEMNRRAVGLASVSHELIKAAGADIYICTKNPDGSLQQQHVISDLLF